MRMLQALLLALLASASTHAQVAGYRYYGAACASANIPFQALNTPRIGESFAMRIAGTRALPHETLASFLFTGFSNRSFGPVTLPWDMSWFQGAGPEFSWQSCGWLHTSSDILFAVPIGTGGPEFYDVVWKLPNDKRLLGVRFYQQAMLVRGSTLTQNHTFLFGRGGVGTIGK